MLVMNSLVFLASAVICNLAAGGQSSSSEPSFLQPIKNETVVKGREAILKCRVSNLAGYKVAWVRVDTQTILTIDSHVISRNVRISLIHSPEDENQWDLRITDTQESDRGWYLCQINTDPMKSTEGYLEVVVPPEIVDTGSSNDALVRDGESATFTCNASGYPAPTIKWKREDDKPLRLGETLVPSINGPTLQIPRVNRHHMGAYLCIASNGVRPSKSKRIELKVQFPPVIWIPNQLERAYVGQEEVTLRCQTEAFPDSINYWTNTDGTMLKPGAKYDITTNRSNHKVDMTLTIRNVERTDIVPYLCVAKNSLGDSDGPIRLEEVEPPPPPPSQTIEYDGEIFPPDDFYTIEEDPLDKGGGISPPGGTHNNNNGDTESTSNHNNAVLSEHDGLTNSVPYDGTNNVGGSDKGQQGPKRKRRPKWKNNAAEATRPSLTVTTTIGALPVPSLHAVRLLLVVFVVVLVPNFLLASMPRSVPTDSTSSSSPPPPASSKSAYILPSINAAAVAAADDDDDFVRRDGKKVRDVRSERFPSSAAAASGKSLEMSVFRHGSA